MRIAVVLLLMAGLLVHPRASGREWTDSTGTYKVEAQFAGCEDGVVRLKKSDGSVIAVPIAQLSSTDKSYVQSNLNCEQTPPVKLSIEDLVARVEPAVVRIDVPKGFGSGFVVDSSGILVY